VLEAWATAYESSGERVALYVMQKAGEAERRIARWLALVLAGAAVFLDANTFG